MMDVRELLQRDEHWRKLLDYVQKGSVPGSIGIEIHSPWQKETLAEFAHYALCENGTACGQCKSCRSWTEDGHPDLLIAGEPDTPSPVDECRTRAGDLCIVPVVAPIRLLAFYAPEKMSPGAVNSLLKITEEPPPQGHVLYLMDKATILPTLRSRLWMLSFNLEDKIEPEKPPASDNEWLRWYQSNEKNNAQEWYALFHGYAAWMCKEGDFYRAAQLNQFAETALTTHLSSAMWADLLFLLLREEYSFDNVFDDFRQAALLGFGRSRERNTF